MRGSLSFGPLTETIVALYCVPPSSLSNAASVGVSVSMQRLSDWLPLLAFSRVTRQLLTLSGRSQVIVTDVGVVVGRSMLSTCLGSGNETDRVVIVCTGMADVIGVYCLVWVENSQIYPNLIVLQHCVRQISKRLIQGLGTLCRTQYSQIYIKNYTILR